MKLKNNLGISIVETMIALSLLVGIALTSSYVLTNTNVIRKREEVKATIDQIHILQVQRARRSDVLKFSDAPTNTIERLSAAQKMCFDGSRRGFNDTDVGCNVFATSGIPSAADWSDSLVFTGFDNTSFGMFGEANLFETEVRWRATCPVPERCTSIDIRITTQVSAGSSLAQGGSRSLDPRVTVLSFPAQFFADQARIRFSCAGANEVYIGINNSTNRALCGDVSAPANLNCASQYPMHNFGGVIASPPPTCIAPANTNCSAASEGYRRISYATKECRNR